MLLDVQALLLFARLPTVQTPEDAKQRIRLAQLALTQMPIEFDCSPARFLTDRSLLWRALEAVDRYLDKEEWPNPGDLQHQLLMSTVGPSEGARIVAGGITALVRAVDGMHLRPIELEAIVRRADRATRSACQANEWGTYTVEALAFLEDLQEGLYSNLPAPARRSGTIPNPPRRSGVIGRPTSRSSNSFRPRES